MTTQARPQNVPTWDISPGAYGALSEALAVIYWNKPAFHRFLRTFLRDHPELLAGIDFMGPKREAADEIVDRLMADELRYHDLTWRLMDDVANREVFPNLSQQTNADYLVEQARTAVAELRRYTTDHAAEKRVGEEFERELADFREKNRPPSFTRIDDTPGVERLKRERGAPEQPECDLSRIAIKLRQVHLFRARRVIQAVR
jgi:hypothetical protein